MTDEFAEVHRRLKRLPVVLRQKIVTKATAAGASLISREAKRRVPVRSGILRQSIGIAHAKKKDTPDGVIRYYVIPKSNLTISRKVSVGGQSARLKIKAHPYHGHFVEWGTEHMDARPYLLPAAKAVQGQVVSTFRAKIYTEIEKEVPKL